MFYQFNQPKRGRMNSLPRLFLAFLCVSLFAAAPVLSQNRLSRISKVDRSDGKGVVIRYHLEEAIDSFMVIQPAPDLIQMVLFDTDIDTSGILLPEQGDKVKEVHLYNLGYGYGVDIYLDEDVYYRASAYPDKNKRHLLLGLTDTDPNQLIAYSQQFVARDWSDEITPEGALEVTPLPIDNSYQIIKEKLRFDTIVIDAGHGGKDPGNIGYGKAKEKDVVLSIAKKLGGYIEKNLPDVKVIYTRDGDYLVGAKENPDISIMESLIERGQIANRAQADLFVSIHADAWHDRSVRGASVFFLGLNRSNKSFEVMKEENQVYNNELIQDLSEEDLLIYELANSGNIATSEKIAYMVEDQLKNRAGRKSRGVKQMGLVVLYQSTMPGILVETGFLTNAAEKRYLTSDYGQSIIASAIFRAIRDYKVTYEKGLLLGKNTSSNE